MTNAPTGHGNGMDRPVSVLIVEDSAVTREYLCSIFSSAPGFTVLGTACNGAEAVRFVGRRRPDAIVMDVKMPVMDGFEATREIMSTNPIPIVILSASLAHDEVALSVSAMAAGALAAFPKPPGPGHPGQPGAVRQLLATVRALADVKLVRRCSAAATDSRQAAAPPARSASLRHTRLVAVGASTGGPPAVQGMLAALPLDFPFPILLVQHICDGFIQGLVDWLNQTSPLAVRLAVNHEPLVAGIVYIAPDGTHLTVGPGERIALVPRSPTDTHCPSVARLLSSATDVYVDRTIGVLLTGMGADGAVELKRLRDRGGTTIIQSRESCVVFGMPGEALKLDAAMHILAPRQIAAFLQREAERK